MTSDSKVDELIERLTQANTWQREDLVSLCFKAANALSALLPTGEGNQEVSSSQSLPSVASNGHSDAEPSGEEFLEFKEALSDIRSLRQEHRDLNGGGPGWSARNQAAWDRVDELFANEDEAAWCRQQEDAHG